jgi:hypothetical protein
VLEALSLTAHRREAARRRAEAVSGERGGEVVLLLLDVKATHARGCGKVGAVRRGQATRWCDRGGNRRGQGDVGAVSFTPGAHMLSAVAVGRVATTSSKPGLGPVLLNWARPKTKLKYSFSNISTSSSFKIQNLHFLFTKIFQTLPGVDQFKRNNFSFGEDFKFQTDFQLKI